MLNSLARQSGDFICELLEDTACLAHRIQISGWPTEVDKGDWERTDVIAYDFLRTIEPAVSIVDLANVIDEDPSGDYSIDQQTAHEYRDLAIESIRKAWQRLCVECPEAIPSRKSLEKAADYIFDEEQTRVLQARFLKRFIQNLSVGPKRGG